MFYRTRDDPTGCEPRMLFNMVEFLMHDKNNSGTIDLDECVTLLYQRYGKEAVDERVREMFRGDDNEKNIAYSKFVEIQKRCRSGARRDPSLRPAAFDPLLLPAARCWFGPRA